MSPNLPENFRRDNEFLIACRSGAKEALNQLIMQYKFAIYFMIQKMVKNRADAEYLTIDTIGKAFENIHQYDPQLAFSTWLWQIAYNNAIDHLHNKKVVCQPFKHSDREDLNFEIKYNLQKYYDTPEESQQTE